MSAHLAFESAMAASAASRDAWSAGVAGCGVVGGESDGCSGGGKDSAPFSFSSSAHTEGDGRTHTLNGGARRAHAEWTPAQARLLVGFFFSLLAAHR